MESPRTRVAAGVLILTMGEPQQFLLMRHHNRWDLPKGHAEAGETPVQTALREMEEETGIAAQDVEMDGGFEYSLEYPVQYRGEPQPVQKRVYYFLARIPEAVEIQCTEHESAQWFLWEPPHRIQEQTIDPLLTELERYLAG